MRAETAAVIDKLVESQFVPWLRVIDEAGLDQWPQAPADAEQVVAPLRWLLDRVGEGLTLTKAGHLPPAVVAETMVALGRDEQWIGKANREEQTWPVRQLRESAQRLGLARKYSGKLLVTKIGQQARADPARLWWRLAECLPLGRSEAERDAGILYLLNVASGRPRDPGMLAEGLSLLGWVGQRSRDRITPEAASAAAGESWALFGLLDLVPTLGRGDPDAPADERARQLARAALLGAPPKWWRAGGEPAGVSAGWSVARDREVRLLISLRGIDPPIWRRVVVPESMWLRELHAVIQIAMGWQNSHLHEFDIEGARYGDPDLALEFGDMDLALCDERRFTVGQAAHAASRFGYAYDFGDGWGHEISVEAVLASDRPPVSRLLAGERACPPEDCGGVGGYEELLAALADPAHEEHESMLEWTGGGFDPERFDLVGTGADLAVWDRVARRRRR
ncbi:MAG: plasmid pRiA4b ORF-3 family protein [Actinomycetia bacterium]|nr:plasmid pRiA4b ORF-3 family protein [Actinomycetes bacterium]